MWIVEIAACLVVLAGLVVFTGRMIDEAGREIDDWWYAPARKALGLPPRSTDKRD